MSADTAARATDRVAPADGPATGTLRMAVELRQGRSVVAEQYHHGALRVLRPHHFDPWQVSYPVINPGGGYLGGDRYEIDVQVGAGAALMLTSQAATKVYRTPQAPARQETVFRVAEGGLLEYLPDQLIMYRQGRYVQDTTIVVAPGGTCIMADVVTPGWSPQGEPFRYDWANLRNRVLRPDGSTLLVDNLWLEPGVTPMTGLGALEGHSHAGSLLVVDRRVTDDLVDRVEEMSRTWADLRVGLSLAPGPAMVVRLLGRGTASLQAAIAAVDDLLRKEWFDLPPVDLRKY